MAVEEPYARVVGDESDDEVALRRQYEYVPPSWRRRERSVVAWIVWHRVAVSVVIECGPIGWCALNDLEIMPMEMKWVRAAIIIIEHNLDYVVVFQDKRMCEFSVDFRIR